MTVHCGRGEQIAYYAQHRQDKTQRQDLWKVFTMRWLCRVVVGICCYYARMVLCGVGVVIMMGRLTQVIRIRLLMS